MEEVTNFLNNTNNTKLIHSVIIIAISILLYKSVLYFLGKGEEKDKLKLFTNKKSKTYLRLMKSILRYIFLAVTVLIVLQINGVDVSSMLAGVGIVGIVLGLAVQDWLKDVIRGSTILSDNYFSVGDIVKYKDIEGKILALGLKTTKIQDIKTGNIVSVANRNIEEIEIVSDLVYINIPMPYEVSVPKAEKVVENILNTIQKNELVNQCRYLGVNQLADSSIFYLIEITCNAQSKLQVRRDALKIVLEEMAKDKIDVPYTQIDVHQK